MEQDPPYGLAEFATGEVAFEVACIQARENLWLLAGGRSMAGLKRLITRKDFGGEQTLAEATQAIDGRFDYIILDTAPGWDALTVNALFYVERVLAPVSLEVMTLQGLTEFARSMNAIQKYRPELELKYILPTFFDLPRQEIRGDPGAVASAFCRACVPPGALQRAAFRSPRLRANHLRIRAKLRWRARLPTAHRKDFAR